ncbi:hypothetical protein [Ancylobacter rudongensis]|uniref:Uncharacterized protein n=1 Tax=Ancylobacter rudongensis TaxID=177413 RepID=A0A1G4URA5_9HYPH|nr:hypothetical protein [Ancylobacter rudongensis]SCW95359.1 hypothetical protein SAMN05660859_0007 [Ancylobacter rudongensis]
MWINLTDQERGLISVCLNALTVPEAKALIARLNEPADPTDGTFVERAREDYEFGSDGDVDIDDTPVVSRSENGAYVMMWGWVSNEDAGLDDESEDFSVEALQDGRWKSIFPKRLSHLNSEHATHAEAWAHIQEHEDNE